MSISRTKIWLASYPRSGNTYARVALRHHFGIDVAPEHGWELGQELFECDLTSGISVRRGSPVYAVKTHLLVKDGSPAIVVVRDGRDALVSHVHFQKQFWEAQGSFERILREMIDPQDLSRAGGDWSSFGWSSFYEHWLCGTSGPTVLVRYEELIRQPLEVIWNALVNVLGVLVVPRTLVPLPPFSEFQRQKPGFFRSGKIGVWKEEMSPELEALFWHHHGEMMTRLGYER
jgi:hypothetical protein